MAKHRCSHAWPDVDDSDIREHREHRPADEAGPLLDGLDPARDRTQEHLVEAEDHRDRHEIEQDQMLDHVHDEQVLVGE
jgi:hypothetical protein